VTELDDHVERTERSVQAFPHPSGRGHTVVLRRTYDAAIDDIWSACTEPDRLARWFLPVRGDLRVGGHYQLEGNAGGEILACEPPRRLLVTWLFGEDRDPDDTSEVELRLTPVDGGTLFELEHRAVVDADFWNRYGPGAVGVGWDLGLVGLAAYLQGRPVPEAELTATPEGRDLVRRSGQAWRAAHAASGADPVSAATLAETTTAFYLGEEPPADG
jgi:uncharacterized protein YndB with AHSA1/START domain